MATCGYCYKDKIVRFKLRLLQWITSIDCNIENFYQTCQCGHFMYLNIMKHFTKEKLIDYFRKGYKKDIL